MDEAKGFKRTSPLTASETAKLKEFAEAHAGLVSSGHTAHIQQVFLTLALYVQRDENLEDTRTRIKSFTEKQAKAQTVQLSLASIIGCLLWQSCLELKIKQSTASAAESISPVTMSDQDQTRRWTDEDDKLILKQKWAGALNGQGERGLGHQLVAGGGSSSMETVQSQGNRG